MSRSLRGALVSTLILAVTVLALACSGPVEDNRETARSSTPTATLDEPPRNHPTAMRSEGGTHALAESPNIVLFLTDDQTLDELEAVPQAQQLIGRTGTTFTHAISSYPLCCPARATLLTGQYAHNHGVLGNEEPWGGYRHFDESSTVPLWLQQAGYRTAIVGKYLNGYPLRGAESHVPVGWDDWMVPVEGAYRYWSFTTNENGQLVRHLQYQATYTAEKVSDLITTYAREDAPFFVWAGFLAPHFGLPDEPDDPDGIPTPAVEDKYRDTETGGLPNKPSLPERDLSDKQRFVRKDRPFDRAGLTEFYQQRRESLRSVDDAVASVIDTLQLTGELENTILIFTSDNGYLIGEHGLNQKVFGYEESIRVPLLISGPGFHSGAVRDQLVSLTDLPATILAAADAEAGLPQDGMPLQPLSKRPRSWRDRAMLIEAGGWPYPDQSRYYTGLRTQDGRVVLRYWDDWVETYDLDVDPYQLDGTTSPAESKWRNRLLRRLDELQTCSGVECHRLSLTGSD